MLVSPEEGLYWFDVCFERILTTAGSAARPVPTSCPNTVPAGESVVNVELDTPRGVQLRNIPPPPETGIDHE